MRKAIVILLTVALALTASVSLFAGGGRELLVDSEWLADRLDRRNIIVVDTGRSADDYRAGHIPGAVYVDRVAYYDRVGDIPGLFPGVEQVVDALEEAGISNRSRVVVYDSGNALWATRLFWTLEYLGHNRVAVLDGGFAKWDAEDLPQETRISRRERGTFRPDVREELIASGDYVLENVSNPDVLVLDARSEGEFTGSDVRAERGGHIPNAVNVDWILALSDGAVPTFLPQEELRELYDASDVNPDQRVVTHCQTGVRGAHSYFVLRLLGYRDVTLYDASWVEWGNESRFPIVTGS
jgi:thiosulfate/3-mercaptopyruvate sulfurtransferase